MSIHYSPGFGENFYDSNTLPGTLPISVSFSSFSRVYLVSCMEGICLSLLLACFSVFVWGGRLVLWTWDHFWRGTDAAGATARWDRGGAADMLSAGLQKSFIN